MSEYVCITLLSQAGESQPDFSTRLSCFWTHLLRTRLAEFEKVYAETTVFEEDAGRWSRQYLVEDVVLDALEREFSAAGLAHAPIDRDELFSKYEATPPEWMQIDH